MNYYVITKRWQLQSLQNKKRKIREKPLNTKREQRDLSYRCGLYPIRIITLSPRFRVVVDIIKIQS